jgi:hypothetical protein
VTMATTPLSPPSSAWFSAILKSRVTWSTSRVALTRKNVPTPTSAKMRTQYATVHAVMTFFFVGTSPACTSGSSGSSPFVSVSTPELAGYPGSVAGGGSSAVRSSAVVLDIAGGGRERRATARGTGPRAGRLLAVPLVCERQSQVCLQLDSIARMALANDTPVHFRSPVTLMLQAMLLLYLVPHPSYEVRPCTA